MIKIIQHGLLIVLLALSCSAFSQNQSNTKAPQYKVDASWPKTLASAAITCEPQRIAYYLIEIASRFHSIWNLGKENSDYRFNIENNQELTAARLAFAEAVRKIIASGFELIGVTPMDKM